MRGGLSLETARKHRVSGAHPPTSRRLTDTGSQQEVGWDGVKRNPSKKPSTNRTLGFAALTRAHLFERGSADRRLGCSETESQHPGTRISAQHLFTIDLAGVTREQAKRSSGARIITQIAVLWIAIRGPGEL